MKKSETCAAQAELKSNTTLDAPIRLTPEQLETIVAGMVAASGGGNSTGTRTGAIWKLF